MKLTKNFNLQEFESKDGAKMTREVMEQVFLLSDNLQIIRDKIGTRLNMSNGYRSPAHNKAVGGVPDSQHLLGKAADLSSYDHTPKELYDIIEDLISFGEISEGGLGLYKSFVHYDIRGHKARWDKTQ